VSYRHWLEHRGCEGLADLLETAPAASATDGSPVSPKAVREHPHPNTTPEEMKRARPDLTTGELKMPVED